MNNSALARKPLNAPARGKRGLASFAKKKTLKTNEEKFRWDLYVNQTLEEEASELPALQDLAENLEGQN